MNCRSGLRQIMEWKTVSAMLVNPRLIKSEQYRYPEQWPFIADLFKLSQEQAVDYVAELHKAAPQFQQVELEWLGNYNMVSPN